MEPVGKDQWVEPVGKDQWVEPVGKDQWVEPVGKNQWVEPVGKDQYDSVVFEVPWAQFVGWSGHLTPVVRGQVQSGEEV